MTMTELTETRVRFEYREEPRDCVHSTCTVDFELELVQRACLATTDPDCVPGKTRFFLAPNAWQEVECECASP